MLRKIVIDCQGVPLGVAEVFADGAGGIRRNVLHGRRLRRRRSHHNGVIHRTIVGENLHDLRDRRPLLPDSAVNTNQVVALAVDDRVESDSGLARLTIPNNQLTLTAANGDHAVDGLETSSHRLTNRLPINNARRQALEGYVLVGGNRSFVVDRLTEGVDDAPNHGLAHWHTHDASGTLNLVAFFYLGVIAEQHNTDLVFLQVHGDTGIVVREGEQFSRHDLVESVDTRNTVAQRDDGAHFVDRNLGFIVLDLLAN